MILWVTIVGACVVWFFIRPPKQRKRKRETPLACSDAPSIQTFFPELSSVPQCSFRILNGKDLQQRIATYVTRAWKTDRSCAECTDGVARILKGDALLWPSFEEWRKFVGKNRSTYRGFPICQIFHDLGEGLPPAAIDAYVSTWYGLLALENEIKRGKDLDAAEFFVICQPHAACCPFCLSLNGRRFPIEMARSLVMVHPVSNIMVGFDAKCFRR